MERAVAGDDSLARALALVRYLRDHCAWDARQTADSLVPYLLEEAGEVADAVRHGDPEELAGELGDLLLNVAFQIVVAEEAGRFDAATVASRLERKMIARHPHVYGDAEEAPDWEALKADERAGGTEGRRPTGRRTGAMEPLSRALRVQEEAAGLGFDWPSVDGAIEKVREEIDELERLVEGKAASPSSAGDAPPAAVVEEAGDLLFAAVNACRLAGVHPAMAMEGATRKFERRFALLLERARDLDIDPRSASLAELDRLWDAVKAQEAGRAL